MDFAQPRPGYTLPVFACAAAIAGLRYLRQPEPIEHVAIDLLDPPLTVDIPIEQVAGLKPGVALAITRSDPGDNLDITRHTPIWAVVAWGSTDQASPIQIDGGEGIGRWGNAGQAAIYAYAKRLLLENLGRSLYPGETLQVTIILPEGRQLAQRTSNAAFGVVEGLSLLGSTGISQPLSAPGQLELYRQELQQKAAKFDCLVFCVGENGLDLGCQLGIDAARLVKTANWIGPLLVEAGIQGVRSILLFGYHGKLIKLAGNIFHTHHHVADARLEILTSHCAIAGLPTADLQAIFASSTTEDALKYLRQLETATTHPWVDQVYGTIAAAIDQRSHDYIRAQSGCLVTVGAVLFDRRRQIVAKSAIGDTLLQQVS
ncbi:cobalt-precorrin-5B (C(1))-methyltransferase CbiD [Pantanalinema sp. GBBB05]|uniref:cobalt-precorrin-5B (C(1))-methyltransferase CbiD n=1 Tax=Pantanalinema sp. GBBB05 TaxID=2604139 RepID=UPI001D8A6EC5|nr:cobalt-precorrin-5B (C(1))-methyltransferase [Pantanalinema sp. GBBB05]